MIFLRIADTGLIKIVMSNSENCRIEKGKPYDVDVLQAERARLERSVRDMGFTVFLQKISTLGLTAQSAIER